MENNQQDFVFDNRIVSRNIRDGRCSRDEFEKHMSSLPDLAGKCDDIAETVFAVEQGKVAVKGEFLSESEEE